MPHKSVHTIVTRSLSGAKPIGPNMHGYGYINLYVPIKRGGGPIFMNY